jgi:oxygen-independent coproporphyrinogen-3 oxidase
VELVSGKPVPRDKIGVFTEQGWVKLQGSELSLTESGRLLADALTAQLAP